MCQCTMHCTVSDFQSFIEKYKITKTTVTFSKNFECGMSARMAAEHNHHEIDEIYSKRVRDGGGDKRKFKRTS